MADGPYLLGIDFGTGGARVGIFDPEGTPLVFSEREYTLKHPRPGWAEQDPDEWWSCLVAAVKGAMEESRISPEDIAGISIDAMSSTVLAINERGRHLRPAIMWMDVRSSEQADRIADTNNDALKYNGYGAVSAEWGLPKALWIKENEPEVYRDARHICDCGDWLIHRLTGEWTSSINTASSKYYYDRDEGGYPESLYDAVDAGDFLDKLEGLGHSEGTLLSHGFKVGVGTVAIAALYELVLERDLGDLDIETLRDSWPTREAMERSVRAQHTSPDLERGAVEQTLAKYISAGELAQRLELLRDVWPGLREKVRLQLMPVEQIREMLYTAGCPTGPVEIGLRWNDFEATYLRARTIRKRYTVLDLAFETGIIEECVDELFAPGGFWGRAAASQAGVDGARLVGSFRSDVREKHDDR